jgi:4-hydroxyphenylacetate 3-monooxygenase
MRVMLRTGADFLGALDDGRTIYVGGERVRRVRDHPAFRGAAATIAASYDLKAAAAQRERLSYEQNGQRYSMYFLPARSREDLRRRSDAHKLLADLHFGFMGRGLDHVTSFVTGLAMEPEVLDRGALKLGSHIARYYEHLRDQDLFASYAVHPAAQAKNKEVFGELKGRQAVLRVTAENGAGIVLNGMKMLATGGVFADEVWIGNLTPLAPDQATQSITCAVPSGTPGLELWVRRPTAMHGTPFDDPLATRFDESDCVVIFRDVKVPWERVFVHNEAELSRQIYLDTPAHAYGNHQSNVRYLAKLHFLLGVMNKICTSAGIRQIPAVAETLGRMAAMAGALDAMIKGQIYECEPRRHGYVSFNYAYVAAALNWCQENHPVIVNTLKELSGGSVFQMPADATVLHNEATRDIFLDYWRGSGDESAIEKMKLYRIAWDSYGSAFGGRSTQYENFYAGASFIVRGHSLRVAPWATFDRLVEEFMATIDVPGANQ